MENTVKESSSPDSRAELDRLKSLERYQVIGPDATINFDDLTNLASQICGTPIALVTLIDQDTAWVKSAVGIEVTTMPRESVFCNQTIRDNFLEIEDLRSNPQYLQNPFVLTTPSIRFYAGTALVNKAGYNLGTLCVLDYFPRRLTEAQENALKALGRQVIALLESKLARDRLKKDFYELQRLSKQSLEQQVRMLHTARITSIGEMANGVAHEVNNPLSVIDHAIEKMNRHHAYDEASIHMIQKAIHRITKIIRGLRDLAQDGNNSPMELLPLESLLYDTVDLYSSRSKEEGIHFHLSSDPSHFIEARDCQIKQILINLVQNAFLSVSEAEEKWISLTSLAVGEDIILSVSHSGEPIPEEERERIFDPFYLSLNSSRSTGLSLAISQRLAGENGGELSLHESPRPVTFVLKFKRVNPASHQVH